VNVEEKNGTIDAVMRKLMKSKGHIKIIFIVLIVIAVIILQYRWELASFFRPDNIKEWLNDAGILAPLLFTGIMMVAVVISPIPSLPLDIAAGAFFGPFLGTVYSVIGASAGAVISFLIARLLGREFVERFLRGHINFCSQCSDKLLTKIVFFSRLLPFISFDVISYGAGLTKMSLKKFIMATFLGMIPLTFVYNYSGSVVVFGKRLTFALGVCMVLLFFLIPNGLRTKV
jgi:uncharacterized membrane protein YdjX (TVP38/TMEM64 family)